MLVRFGSFELDTDRFELRREGMPVAMQPRVLETIAFLVEHRGQVVHKDHLIAGPWRGVIVSDTALSQAVRQARVALGDNHRAPRLIRTIRGKGFRFEAEVEIVEPVAHGKGPGLAAQALGGRPFFGRSAELGHLRVAASEARSSRGNLVLVHGPAGVGKTRLTEWFVNERRNEGVEICWGGCREGQTAPPFWPWPEILTRYAEAHDGATLERLARGRAGELVALVPELSDWLGEQAQASGDESPQRASSLLDAVSGFFRRAAADAPLVLVLEDLHLADTPALELFEALARSLGDTRLLVVATCRTAEGRARPLLERALEGGLPHLRLLELAGLSVDDLREWLGAVAHAPVPDDVVRALHFSTEGHPLLLENLVRVLPDDWSIGAAGGGTPRSFSLPDKIREVLERRLSTLDATTRELLRGAAVFGEEFPIGVLATARGETLAVLLPRLEEAEHVGLLKGAEQGRMRFAHALHRDLLYFELSRSARREQHLAAARAFAAQLEHRPELVVQAAHHFVEAVPTADSQEVVAFARRAAEWARARYAYSVAERHYKKALEVLELSPDEPRMRGELLFELGYVQFLIGNVSYAEETFDATFELSRAHGFDELFCRALLAWFQMRRESVIVDRAFHMRLNEALEVLAITDPALKAQLLVARAMAHTLSAPASERATWVQEALQLARASGDAGVLVEVLRGTLKSNVYLPDGTSLLEVADAMVRAARAVGSLGGELEAGLWRANGLLEVGRGREFLEQIHKCEQQAETLGAPHWKHMVGWLRGCTAYMRGDFESAIRIAVENAAIGEKLVGIAAASYCCAHLFVVGIEVGDQDTQTLTKSLAYGEKVLKVAPAYHALSIGVAQLRLYLGDDRAAREVLKEVMSSDFSPDPLDRSLLPVSVLLADISCWLDASSAAAKIALWLKPWCGRHATSANGSVYLGPISYWLGRLAIVLGGPTEAHQFLRAAISESDAAQCVAYRAWSRYYLYKGLPFSERSERARLMKEARRLAQKYRLERLDALMQNGEQAESGSRHTAEPRQQRP